MVKRTRALIAVLLVLVAGTGGWRALHQREPTYGGKPLNSWLAELDFRMSRTPEKANEAICAVRTMGTNCFPSLIRMLRADEPLWKRAAITFNEHQSVVCLPILPAGLIRARAIEGYTVLGISAEGAVPELIELMNSNASPQVRACVATALGRIGPSAREAIPVLRRAMRDENPEVRQSALFALANIQVWMNEHGL